ncbi:hypothetical protein OsJ_05398 [Oryza sativa Japonica Group]|uniref:cellulase n=1 Tax=Oryza sativa subsp. japonica TaxID=39947 RepID=B9F2R8_ORYSJ|nr:hypothetical protein OsJ_05398 [Oryza sativa Japonica Group]
MDIGEQLLVEEKHLSSQQREVLEKYRSKAEYYVCSCMGRNPGGAAHNAGRTPAGLLFIRPWNNLQYVSNAAFLLTVYSDVLSYLSLPLLCPDPEAAADEAAPAAADAGEVLEFARSQADYILGTNPMATSLPRRGFDSWYSAAAENPHDLVGAVVGGPNGNDVFTDHRGAYMQTEACTYTRRPMVGVFSRLMELERQRRGEDVVLVVDVAGGGG